MTRGNTMALGIRMISRSAIYLNEAGDTGGGIYSSGAIGAVNVSNSTIYSNASSGAGGGFLHYQGTSNLTHVTMVHNRSPDNGGALRKSLGGTLRLRNSIIAGTTSDGSTRFRRLSRACWIRIATA